MIKEPFLGAKYTPQSTIFTVASQNAKSIELCLFSEDEKEEKRILLEKEGDLWITEIKNIPEGQKYGYRAYGEFDPSSGLFFNPNKLAVDPYGLEVSKSFSHWQSDALSIENNQDSAWLMPKSKVVNLARILDNEQYPHLNQKPNFSIGKNIIYETHIKNFSILNDHIPEAQRGTLKALSNDWTIEYFQKIGVNNIELMPINPTCPGKQIPEKEGRFDNWGYNPYCYFAIDPRYGNLQDLAEVINKLHQNNIKLTIDAVFNHTGEHDALGPSNKSLSFKLLDSPSYYRPNGDNKAEYMNSTGCRNNFNLDSKLGRRMLHHYIQFMHRLGVDGIRWDLAGDNALNEYWHFQENGGFIKELKYAAEDLKLENYVEPWSALGGNYTGRFSQIISSIKEWSDKRRDFTADFFSARENTSAEFGNQTSGSAIISGNQKESAVVGTAFTHDGFSLVGAFKHHKDTRDNGEDGRDGSADTYAKSSDEEELYRRAASAAALNILSKGIPLLRNGDERSYASPNNNPYCIDDQTVWINWKKLSSRQKRLFKQICKLNALRQKHPIFTDLTLYNGKENPENGVKDITWLRPDASEMTTAEWQQPNHKTGAYMLNGAKTPNRPTDDDFLIMISGDDYYTVNYKLPTPPSGGKWQLLLDTSEGDFKTEVKEFAAGTEYALKPYSFVIMIKKKVRSIVNQKQLLNHINKMKQQNHSY